MRVLLIDAYRVDDPDRVVVDEAVATATTAQREGLTEDDRSPDVLRKSARTAIGDARASSQALLDAGSIRRRPDRTDPA